MAFWHSVRFKWYRVLKSRWILSAVTLLIWYPTRKTPASVVSLKFCFGDLTWHQKERPIVGADRGIKHSGPVGERGPWAYNKGLEQNPQQDPRAEPLVRGSGENIKLKPC